MYDNVTISCGTWLTSWCENQIELLRWFNDVVLPMKHDVKPLPMQGNYLFLNDILKSVHIVKNTIP